MLTLSTDLYGFMRRSTSAGRFDGVVNQRRVSFTEKFASYYGNLRGLLLGSNLAGRRPNYQENVFPEEAQLTSFKTKDKDGKEDGQIKPKTVDFLRSLNRQAHRSSDYEIPNLIIRRGQQFEIRIIFDKPFSCDNDDLVLKFVTGRQPLQSKGTVVPVHRVKSLKKPIWAYQLIRVEDKVVHLKVATSHDAIVGRYNLFIETSHKNDNGDVDKCRYAQPDDIYLLFNPWCPEGHVFLLETYDDETTEYCDPITVLYTDDDQVYLEEESHREEYVLNETGRIWLGTVGKFCVRPWNFGQFDDVCLVAAIAIMEKSELGDQARGNAVHVIRALSRVINNNERDGGVVIGNWSGKYDDGVAPYAWNGSTTILEEFLKKRKGVKFGQCWTFAAVATTVFRALGIPTRCVTSFKSAHDSDYSSEMDAYWTPDGKPRKSLDDSIWDFHVWNESWTKRPDLPSGYDGWQAYDPTPQESLEGVFTCGPASVKAIKQGEIFYGYDTKFMFAEVNGDRVQWTVDQDGNMVPVAMDRGLIGKCISTKAFSTISREDLTNAYKHPEGSVEESVSAELANRLSCRRCVEVEEPACQDIDFSIHSDMQRTGDFSVTIDLKNVSGASRLVTVHISAVACRYTGVANMDIRDTCTANVLEPGTESQVTLAVKCGEYLSGVDADSHVNIYAIATVKETSQRFIVHDSLWIEKPHLELKTEGSAHVAKPFDILIKLVNPLAVPMTSGHISIEAPGMQRIASIKVKKSILPGEEIRETVQMKPRRLGRKEIIANFQCKQISDVTGVTEIDVTEDTRG